MKVINKPISLSEIKKIAKERFGDMVKTKTMSYQHSRLAAGGWKKLSFYEQMAHVGSEVERAISWREKGNTTYCQNAFIRALELLFLTIDFCQKKSRLKELTRLYEVLVDDFAGKNEFCSSAKLWRHYFFPFAFAVKDKRNKL